MSEQYPPIDIVQPNDFSVDICNRFPLIESNDAHTFEQAILAYNPPLDFLKRLILAHHYIDEVVFRHELKEMAEKVLSISDGNDYSLLITDSTKSNLWIYSQLIPYGLHQAKKIYSWEDYPEEGFLPIRKYRPRKEEKLFLIDDLSISGGQIVDDILGQLNSPYEAYVFLLHASQTALNTIKRRCPQVVTNVIGEPIQLLKQQLTKEDIAFIKRLEIKTTPSNKKYEHRDIPQAFFGLWYKIPDNYPLFLCGGEYQTIPPLVRPENIIPPYK